MPSKLSTKFDHLLDTRFDSDGFPIPNPHVAVVRATPLKPVGADRVVYPPTYGSEENEGKNKGGERSASVYCINAVGDKKQVDLDSVGSQANRVEPMFKEAPYDKLVPKLTCVRSDGVLIDGMDAAHRLADAIFRTSTLQVEIDEAFKAASQQNHEPMARFSPMSLLHGLWNSRTTPGVPGIKLRRIISSVITAYDVVGPRLRGAQYNNQFFVPEDFVCPADREMPSKPSSIGAASVPQDKLLAGVYVNGDITQHTQVLLVAIRGLWCRDATGKVDEDKTRWLRRYVLGLALVEMTMQTPNQYSLRVGCDLVVDPSKTTVQYIETAAGDKLELQLDHKEVYQYTLEAATQLGLVGVAHAGKYDSAALIHSLKKKGAAKSKGRGKKVAQSDEA